MSLTTNIVSYWKLDGNSTDSVGANNGADSTITYSTANGKINQGAGFNGSSSSINLGTTSTLNTSSFTITAWVMKTSNGYIFDRDGVTGVGTDRCYGFSVSAGVLMAEGFSSSASKSLNGGTTLTNGVWYFCAYTYDGSVATVYLNGIQDAQATWAITMFTHTTGTFMGKRSNSTNFLTGDIDEVGFWSRALSSTEITQLYNGGAGIQYPFVHAIDALLVTGD